MRRLKTIFSIFLAPDAVSASDLDPLRLGFEAGRNHDTELGELVFGDDADNNELKSALLLACLRDRNSGVRDALSTAFGGNPALFWSLYSSIWPEFKKPMNDAMDDLLNLRTAAEEGDLDRQWQFVTNGWIDFSEE